MFIAHLPAGYCLTATLLRTGLGPKNKKIYHAYLAIGLISSILPDIDLIYFYFFDLRRHPHHTYITHTPIFWFSVAFLLLSLGELLRNRVILEGTLIAISNLTTHLILDSIASKIKWLHPVNHTGYGFFHVPSKYGWWVLNYVGHWTFALEIMIVVAAGYMLYYKRNSNRLKENHKGRFEYAGNRFDRGR